MSTEQDGSTQDFFGKKDMHRRTCVWKMVREIDVKRLLDYICASSHRLGSRVFDVFLYMTRCGLRLGGVVVGRRDTVVRRRGDDVVGCTDAVVGRRGDIVGRRDAAVGRRGREVGQTG